MINIGDVGFYNIDGDNVYVYEVKYSSGYVDCLYKKNAYLSVSYVTTSGSFFSKKLSETAITTGTPFCVKGFFKSKPRFYTGTDPEFFVEDKDGNNIPAFSFLPSKTERKLFTPENTTVYWDGFQGEFETKPSDCHSFHVDSIFYGIQTLYNKVKDFKPGAIVSGKTVVDVSLKEMESLPTEFVQFGCMPSFNVYNMTGINTPGNLVPFRSAGGHIHFGTGLLVQKETDRIVRGLDAVLGIIGVSALASWDDPRRRTLYGLAGEYRLPPHGLEYRTLSNAWMFHPVLAHIFLDIARWVVDLSRKGVLAWECDQDEVVYVINNCHVEGAMNILKKNKDNLKYLLTLCNYEDKINAVIDLIFSGADKYFTNNLVANWKLSSPAAERRYYENIYNEHTKWALHSDHPNGAVMHWDMKIINKEAKVA